MRILHLCLACFYKEGFSYQENVLPRIHKEQGNEVIIAAPAEIKNSEGNMIYAEKNYINEDDILVRIIFYKKSNIKYVSKIYKLFKIYKNLAEVLEVCDPDIIFIHGGQSLGLKKIINYARKKNVKIYIDQHADYYNTPINGFKAKIFNKVIGYYMRKIQRYCLKFWGVTPWRCQYLSEVYGIDNKKIGLLVMGGEDKFIDFSQKEKIHKTIREKLNIKEDDFLIITGGKIDKSKNIHLLMQAVSNIKNDRVHLIVFGKPDKEMEFIINKFSKCSRIHNIGWLKSTAVYEYFLASDLGVFPGTHSVLWEQACACGIPIVVKNWEGMHHVDLGGNCKFLYKNSVEEIEDTLLDIIENVKIYDNMKKIAIDKCIKEFSYNNIAKKAIGK